EPGRDPTALERPRGADEPRRAASLAVPREPGLRPLARGPPVCPPRHHRTLAGLPARPPQGRFPPVDLLRPALRAEHVAVAGPEDHRGHLPEPGARRGNSAVVAAAAREVRREEIAGARGRRERSDRPGTVRGGLTPCWPSWRRAATLKKGDGPMAQVIEPADVSAVRLRPRPPTSGLRSPARQPAGLAAAEPSI